MYVCITQPKMPRKSVKDVMLEWVIKNAVLDIEITEGIGKRAIHYLRKLN